MAFNHFSLFLFFLLHLTIYAAQLQHPFKQCSSRRTGEIVKASVNAPCGKEYCTFYKGTDARLEFTFTLRKKAHKIRAKVVATIGTIDHDFVLPNHDVCQLLGCPLQNNVPYSYHNSMFVSPTYPSVKINQMRYYLIDVTEYRTRYLSPRREDYIPHVALPKIGTNRLPSRSRSFVSYDVDPDYISKTSEYGLCFPNHRPKRPYVFHEQPTHIFDPLPTPNSSRSESNSSSPMKFSEYQERFATYRSSLPMKDSIPSYMTSQSSNFPLGTTSRKERMTRSQYFHELIAESDQSNGGQRYVGNSEQRIAFQWPTNVQRDTSHIYRPTVREFINTTS
ncbi:hypothetical protein I4U23_024959 [Adineta vaga]|nr:hypothetical protein I4U23_024959 [Adineta vaga]